AWCSDGFIKSHGFETPFTRCPELCVEILSPSNSQKEMDLKMALYFERGCVEVWLVTEEGEIRYYNINGQIDSSGFDLKPRL
ncbi:MAG: Uma2 family endonuclease, partial [Spirochaetota bacterium]|nr:Uma2 family endonuclease [Spirochaetota bacterium]